MQAARHVKSLATYVRNFSIDPEDYREAIANDRNDWRRLTAKGADC